MIGLALPEITSGLGDVSINAAIGYSVLITAVLIVGRILSSYGAVAFTLVARHFITVADERNPGFKGPLIIGWTGMRGVVSLAAALSIPLHLENGSPFPQRNLILFITFVVILLTLLLQGLTLPFLIRRLNFQDRDRLRPEEEIDNEIKQQLARYALEHLNTHYLDELKRQPLLQQIAHKWENSSELPENMIITEESKTVYRDILNLQRLWLIQKNKEEQALDEEMIRRHLHRIDMEEEKWRLI